MSHSHHHHEVKSYNKAFAIGIFLNISFVVIELFYGYMSQSIALIADAGHNFSDVISLVLAWTAIFIAKKKTGKKHTYGYKRVTIMASLISAVFLFITLGIIGYEAILRFNTPQDVDGFTVIIVAGIGVVINTATALLFVKDQHKDLNIKGAYLHMAADAAVSLGVVISGFIILYTQYTWIDPLLSLCIVLIILLGTWGLFKDSFNLSIDAVPEHINLEDVEEYLLAIKEVSDIHDLHIWALSTSEVALSVHLFIAEEPDSAFLSQLSVKLEKKFGIGHITIQIEDKDALDLCKLNQKFCV